MWVKEVRDGKWEPQASRTEHQPGPGGLRLDRISGLRIGLTMVQAPGFLPTVPRGLPDLHSVHPPARASALSE